MPRISTVRSNSILGRDRFSVAMANSELFESGETFNNSAQGVSTVVFVLTYRVRRPETLYYTFNGSANYPAHFRNSSNSGTISKFIGTRTVNNGHVLVVNQTSAYSASDTSTLGVDIRTVSTSGTIITSSPTQSTVNNFRAIVEMQNNTGGSYTTDAVTYGPGETEVSSGITISRQVRWRVRMPPFNKYSIFMTGQSISYSIVPGSAGASDFTSSQGISNGIQFDNGLGVFYVFGGTSLNADGLTENAETFQVAFQYPSFSGSPLGISALCTIAANST